MLALALIIFVGPLIGGGLSLFAGIQLCRARSALGLLIVALISAIGLLAVWEMRYDLGLDLPDLDTLPSGAATEKLLVILAAVLLGTLLLAALRWPSSTKGRWAAIVAVLFWGTVIGAGLVLSGVDFRH
ncbi:hypothetical protein [uncultured Shimia sp.]|uniref:hypothetical protein n=1 Tax=uncultured Shimia sp. TaxID=573152 RepID=UPI0026396A5A|nr:hypothetical protein [uncultured Shimia sp.]